MREILELTCTPTGEECEQIGPNYRWMIAKQQCRVFKDQLERMFPPVGGAYLKITSNNHDFGVYHEVAAVYNDESENETEWAFNIEANLPEYWDQKGLALLDSLSVESE